MTLSVRFANMEWRILSRYREMKESKKFGSFDLSVSFADTSTKEMSCRMTLSVRFANMEWRILSRYREMKESKKFGSFL